MLKPALLLMFSGALCYGSLVQNSLSGFCGAPTTCTNDGISTLVHSADPTFGFSFNSVKKGVTGEIGDDVLAFALPDNEVTNPSGISFDVTSTNAGTSDTSTVTDKVTLASSKIWNYGYLGVFLGNFGQPNQLFKLYSPSGNPDVAAINPADTGYFIFWVDLGPTFVGQTAPVFSLDDFAGISALPKGTFIVDFLHMKNSKGMNDGTIATTNTTVLLTDTSSGGTSLVPEPAGVLLLGTILLCVVRLAKKRFAA